MPRPSMFSNNYEKQMKRRRSNFIFSLVVLLGISAFLFFIQKGTLLKNVKDNLILMITKKEDEKVVEPKKNTEIKAAEVKPKVVENKTSKKEIVFINDEKATLIINNNKIQSVGSSKDYYIYELNSSKLGGIAYNKNNQNTYFFDIKGNVKDITYKQYISTNGTVFNKNDILSSKKDFIWMASPRFIDDKNIAYISQVPWFNKTQYLWTYNISEDIYKCIFYNENIIGGNSIEFKAVNEEVLEVVVDDNYYNITSLGIQIKK